MWSIGTRIRDRQLRRGRRTSTSALVPMISQTQVGIARSWIDLIVPEVTNEETHKRNECVGKKEPSGASQEQNQEVEAMVMSQDRIVRRT